MCVKYFERELMVDLVKSEKIHNFWSGEIVFLKKEGGGMWNIDPTQAWDKNLRTPQGKGKAKYVSFGEQSQAPWDICQYLTRFLENRLSLWPPGKVAGHNSFGLGGEVLLLWSVLSSWDSKKGCCLANNPGVTESWNRTRWGPVGKSSAVMLPDWLVPYRVWYSY